MNIRLKEHKYLKSITGRKKRPVTFFYAIKHSVFI